jgi:2-polyprenyl-6-methoxyphenol hydroxylase-like FAD-dependent oxidoreductase
MSPETGKPGFDVAPVAIIGSGPVGMFLALDLARYNIPTVLVDTESQSRTHPKGSTHNTRTMEHYRRIGLADRIRTLGLPQDQPTDAVYLTRLDGYELGRIQMPSSREKIATRDGHEVLDQVPEPLHRVNQVFVEQFVHAQVSAEPLIRKLYGREYLGAERQEDGWRLNLRHCETRQTQCMNAKFLVGCDGPRSTVRREIGTRYAGDD